MKNEDPKKKNSRSLYNGSDKAHNKMSNQTDGIKNIPGGSKVRNSFEYETDRFDDTYSNDQPTYKGEVYFSNPPKSDISKLTGTRKISRKKIRRKEKITILLMISVILVFSALLSSIAISCVDDILAINRSGEIVSVNIPEGASTNQIIKILNENGLIKQRIFCDIFIGLVSKFEKSKTPKYLNGVYYVKSNMGLEAMLNEFKSVQVAAKTIKLVFPEGLSIYQIIDKLDENDVCKSDYLFAALKETKFNYSFVSQIKDNDARTQPLEGYFFPDTYEFYINENANSVIRRFLSNFNNKWTAAYSKRADKLGLTIDQTIIIASIIQKEAADSEQMPLISSVIHNRLDHPADYPALGFNSTGDYIRNIVKPVLGDAKANEYMQFYSTFITQGLPPGPICNPGIDAIEAALYPQNTNYYYFQHDDSGKIYLASTLAEQNANTLAVLRANNK
jgi:UPF0755 protein